MNIELDHNDLSYMIGIIEGYEEHVEKHYLITELKEKIKKYHNQIVRIEYERM